MRRKTRVPFTNASAPLKHPLTFTFSSPKHSATRASFAVRAASDDQAQVIKPINGDPFIGMLETPVTSAPVVANFLSNLPAYRTGVSR